MILRPIVVWPINYDETFMIACYANISIEFYQQVCYTRTRKKKTLFKIDFFAVCCKYANIWFISEEANAVLEKKIIK